MRIGFIGQAAFGESVFKALLDRGFNVVAAFCPPDVPGKPVDPLKTAAEERGVALHQFKRMRDQVAVDAFRALNVDLGVMAFVTDIVPLEIIDAPAQGTINFHPSILPRHRGPSSINWPIIQGETETGLTVFWPDEGLDTGPILLQKHVEIKPDDTLGSLYFGRIFPMGVDAMVEAVNLVAQGTAPRIEQDHSKATYESWCKAKDVVIDWSKPLAEIYNLVRGSDPSPGSGTTFRGEGIKFFQTARNDDQSVNEPPGTVTSIDQDGFAIAAKGGALRVERVQPDGAKKLSAGEWARSVGLKAGDRFGD